MGEHEEALQLKRRARRRLVGAIALVTFVVIILPLILDKEPGPVGPPLSVQIPNQDAGGFTTRVAPPAPEKKAEIASVNAGPAARNSRGAGQDRCVARAGCAERPGLGRDSRCLLRQEKRETAADQAYY